MKPIVPDILTHYGSRHTAYLHPKGEPATRLLAEKLDAQPGECILELGFGTASSLVFMASKYPRSTFYGLEANTVMFQKAKQRIGFCRLENVQLLHADAMHIPFETGFFDAAYIESVLAIQEGEKLPQLLREIVRVLKPGARLMLNEGIWAEGFPMAEILQMNDHCKRKFGIIQANAQHPYRMEWEKLLTGQGLVIEGIDPLDQLQTDATQSFRPVMVWSRLFSAYGFLLSVWRPGYLKRHLAYRHEMKLLSKKQQYLTAYLFNTRKPI